MARIGESADLLKCSFCGKSQKQVQQLIAGPGVYIFATPTYNAILAFAMCVIH